jgi:hypothetical protein
MATKKAVKKADEFDYKSIDSIEAAYKKVSFDPINLPDVSKVPDEFQKEAKASVALFKLMLFYKAINNGWIARMGDGNQAKYFPWAYVSSSGLGFSVSGYHYAYADAGVGSRLCTDTSEKALFAFKICEDLYKEWML